MDYHRAWPRIAGGQLTALLSIPFIGYAKYDPQNWSRPSIIATRSPPRQSAYPTIQMTDQWRPNRNEHKVEPSSTVSLLHIGRRVISNQESTPVVGESEITSTCRAGACNGGPCWRSAVDRLAAVRAVARFQQLSCRRPQWLRSEDPSRRRWRPQCGRCQPASSRPSGP
jgi:hypothetical protein